MPRHYCLLPFRAHLLIWDYSGLSRVSAAPVHSLELPALQALNVPSAKLVDLMLAVSPETLPPLAVSSYTLDLRPAGSNPFPLHIVVRRFTCPSFRPPAEDDACVATLLLVSGFGQSGLFRFIIPV